MKKLCFLLVSFLFCCSFTFAEFSDQAEEIDFLLFLPNSSNQFENEEQALIQLDNLARYLTSAAGPGRIYVLGYTAAAQNDIDPMALSKDRALFVISELQKRGVSKELFSEPLAYGSVDLWGSNANEEDRSPNRRVRVMQAADSEVEPASIDVPTPVREETITAESGSKISWKILLPLILIPLILVPLVAALVFFASKNKRDSTITAEKKSEPEIEQKAVSVQTINIVIDLDEEIRCRAYELYERRNDQNGDAEGDWYVAVRDICTKYEAGGYRCSISAGCWQAAKTSDQ